MLNNGGVVTGPIGNLTNAALAILVEATLGEKPPPEPKPIQLAPEELATLAGEYESPRCWESRRSYSCSDDAANKPQQQSGAPLGGVGSGNAID